jgi:hypothetical protein
MASAIPSTVIKVAPCWLAGEMDDSAERLRLIDSLTADSSWILWVRLARTFERGLGAGKQLMLDILCIGWLVKLAGLDSRNRANDRFWIFLDAHPEHLGHDDSAV